MNNTLVENLINRAVEKYSSRFVGNPTNSDAEFNFSEKKFEYPAKDGCIATIL